MQYTTTDPSSSPAPTADPLLPTPDGPAAANAERHALKRTYLTLLPHTQLVELCLAFEAYSPLHVKDSLWPANLAVAVDELQLVPPPPPPLSSQDTRKDIAPSTVAAANASLTSVSSLPGAVVQSSPTGALGTGSAIDPNLPPDHSNGHTTTTGDESSRPQLPQTSDDASQPALQLELSASSSKPSATELPQSYPHAPYGYPHTQSIPAYPHTPYYPPLSYPHSFPPQPPAPYPHHAAFPPSHPPFPPAGPLGHHPHSNALPSTEHSGMPSDDLPSYEDMLVEALTDMNESDGSAPKSLFTWMASRYPLHTNFRPSASQALQKAFKRGRLEKGSNGKYRLNASWDGGSTSRRTTRRPQSFAQMVLPPSHGPPNTSPFTHAPLSQSARGTQAHNASTPAPTSMQEKMAPYPHYPYPYTPGTAYPRYGSSVPTPASKEISTEQQSATAVTGEAAPAERNTADEEVGEGSDAWEAAQAILKAINFGSLLQGTTSQPSPSTNSIHAEPVSDRATASASAPAGPVQSLSERDRASLQAQLALLAAQLAEIAEDTLASDLNVTDQDADAEEGNGTVADDDDVAEEGEMD